MDMDVFGPPKGSGKGRQEARKVRPCSFVNSRRMRCTSEYTKWVESADNWFCQAHDPERIQRLQAARSAPQPGAAAGPESLAEALDRVARERVDPVSKAERRAEEEDEDEEGIDLDELVDELEEEDERRPRRSRKD